MQPVAENIKSFFKSFSKKPIIDFETLPKSGGDRIYFRIITAKNSYIATYNENIKENIAFLNFTEQLKIINAPLPEIYKVDKEQKMYLQEDFGKISLLNKLEQYGLTDYVYDLFKKSLKALAWLQISGDKKIDYDFCITSKDFGKQAILNDLLYFKYYFLDTLKIPYDKERLIDDFDAFSTYLDHAKNKYFMFRDFQSRNIYIKNNEVHFIDYAGEILKKPLDRLSFISQYNGYVLIRLLQVLGAYGFRGLFERKAHFLISIPLALTNLKWFLENKETGIALPEFERILHLIIRDNIIDAFKPVQADDSTPLIVKINSFSYLKTGYPLDESDNRGGFVFDCRGLMNPGRFEEFKQVTGRDKPVIDFLEQQSKMPEFLNSVYNIVDIAVEDYIRRSFSSLMINFGCTGGQHRSVYAADALTRHLRNKFNVKVDLHHIEQNIHEKKGF